MRTYPHETDPSAGDLFTVEEFWLAVDSGLITDYDGFGHWVKDGMESLDQVFSTRKEDATHVMWYNK